MNSLMTIGYEGSTLEQFLATLKLAGVTTLLDVRELPLSRRKGFSKNALSEALRVVGINYRHERDLGSPKAIRHQLHEDGDYEQYFADFGKYLKQHKGLLAELAASLNGGVALMCFERDPLTCHRSAVAKQLGSLCGLNVKHLGVVHGTSKARAGLGYREGVSAA